MVTVRCLRWVEYRGRYCQPRERIRVDEKTADELLRWGAVELVESRSDGAPLGPPALFTSYTTR